MILTLADVASPWLLLAALSLLVGAAAAAGQMFGDLAFGDGADWKCLNGQWQETDGEIRPPDRQNLHSRAFYVGDAYDDVTVEFEYYPTYRETGCGDAGLILRARDGGHGYLVTFPWAGVQMRAKHFWAGLAKLSGDGYQRYVKFAWAPNVVSDTHRWYRVKVEAKGPVINVWVDGRHALTAADDEYKSGFVGLAGYGWYTFRNLRVAGSSVERPVWDETFEIPSPAVELAVKSTMPSGGMLPNGDVLMLCEGQLLRSTDRGRTWLDPVALPSTLLPTQGYMYSSNTLHCMKNGRLIIYRHLSPEPPYPDPPKSQIFISESTDNGLTWSDPAASKVADEGWPAQEPADFPYGPYRPYGPLVETDDGVLVSLVIGTDFSADQKRPSIHTWGSTHTHGAAIRSTDGGASWSGPIQIDQPTWMGERLDVAGVLDFTEATGVAYGSTIMVLIRPIASAMMWQCWSHDSGATWEPAVRTPFPGYAQTMMRLESGAILVAKRFPNHSINVSHDGGLNWDQGTIVDYPAWAMGLMVEVEPNVVLCTYHNAELELPLLAQRFEVTREGIYPVKP